MSYRRSQPQQGIALISVLLLLVFILTLVGGMFYRHQIHIQKVTRSLISEQALLLLMSAESWASKLLADDSRESATDHLKEDWARNLPMFPIEGGTISGCMMDLQARYNLNNLAGYTNKSWDDELAVSVVVPDKTSHRTVLRNLLDLAGLNSDDTRVAALVDWVDADAWLLQPDSAEDNEYLLADPPYRAANHALVELSELSLVQGFEPADIIGLRPYVTVLPESTAINVNTVQGEVMAALLPAVTDAVYSQMDEARPFDSLDEFYTLLAGAVGETRQSLQQRLPSAYLSIGSHYFMLMADVELAGIHMAYDSILFRSGETVEVLRRSLRFIPDLAQESDSRLRIKTLCHQVREQTS